MKETFSEIELRRLDLNLLLTFSAIMRERSVSKAANRLYQRLGFVARETNVYRYSG